MNIIKINSLVLLRAIKLEGIQAQLDQAQEECAMKLYHFTGEQHVASIMRHGLVLGMIPDPRGIKKFRGAWLTSNPSWQQGWSTRPVPCDDHVACDRTAVRLTIVIPKAWRHRLRTWAQCADALGWPDDWKQRFAHEGGNDDASWYLFWDRVQPSWIRKTHRRPDPSKPAGGA